MPSTFRKHSTTKKTTIHINWEQQKLSPVPLIIPNWQRLSPTIIESNYTDVNFTIFETRQFNEFMNLFFPDSDHQPKILVIPFATLFRGSSKCPPSFHSKNSFSTFGSSLRISACLRVLSPTFDITLFFVFSSRSPRLI